MTTLQNSVRSSSLTTSDVELWQCDRRVRGAQSASQQVKLAIMRAYDKSYPRIEILVAPAQKALTGFKAI
jgi:hypothetical protein